MAFLDLFRRPPRTAEPPPLRLRDLQRQLTDISDSLDHLRERFERHLRRESGMMARQKAAQEAPGDTIDSPEVSQVPPPGANALGRRRALRGF